MIQFFLTVMHRFVDSMYSETEWAFKFTNKIARASRRRVLLTQLNKLNSRT